MKKLTAIAAILVGVLSITEPLFAHHVLGRPAYSLNEDSNTPPGLSVETQIGEYFVTYMVFPAFPKANQVGRINLYISKIDNGQPFIGDVKFFTQDDSWFEQRKENLGVQQIDDGVYRQRFQFREDGDYIISAKFFDKEEYILDFPLTVGQPKSYFSIGLAIAAIIIGLLGFASFVQRKKLLVKKIQSNQIKKQK